MSASAGMITAQERPDRPGLKVPPDGILGGRRAGTMWPTSRGRSCVARVLGTRRRPALYRVAGRYRTGPGRPGMHSRQPVIRLGSSRLRAHGLRAPEVPFGRGDVARGVVVRSRRSGASLTGTSGRCPVSIRPRVRRSTGGHLDAHVGTSKQSRMVDGQGTAWLTGHPARTSLVERQPCCRGQPPYLKSSSDTFPQRQ